MRFLDFADLNLNFNSMLKTNHELAPMEVASFFVVENWIIKKDIITKRYNVQRE